MKLHDMSIVRRWLFGVRVAHKAQIKSAARADHMQKLLGIPATVISAIVGTAVFASLSESHPEKWMTIVVGLFSVLAAVLAALQTYLGFSERAEQHRKSAGRYGIIRRQLEELLATYSDEHPCDVDQIETIGKTWSEIEAAAPTLSQSLYAKIAREVRLDQSPRRAS